MAAGRSDEAGLDGARWTPLGDDLKVSGFAEHLHLLWTVNTAAALLPSQVTH